MNNDIQIEYIRNKFNNIPLHTYLHKEDIVLLTLLDTRCTNSRLVMELFDFKLRKYASRLLNNISNKGYIKNYVTDNSNSLGKIYQLTNEGSERALELKGMPLSKTNENDELVCNYRNEYENRINKKAIPHSICVNKFYISLLKCKYDFKFDWFEERETMIKDSDNNIIIRPDASFIINKNQFFHLELDMGTESKKLILKKLSNYQKYFLHSNDNPNPKILFAIDLEMSLDKFTITKIKKSFKNLIKEEHNLKSDIKKLKDKIKLNNIIGEDDIDLEEEKIRIEEAINSKFISKKEKNRLNLILHEINNVNTTKDENYIKKLKIMKDRHEELEEQIEEKFNNAKNEMYEYKYGLRIRNIKNYMYGVDENKGLIYAIKEKGIDVYVNKANILRKYINEYVIPNKTGMAQLTLLLECLKNDYTNKGYSTSMNINDKDKIFFNHEYFIIDRLITIETESNINKFYLFDLSFNNIGAEYRCMNLINSINNSFDGTIFIITDNRKQSLQIANKFEVAFVNKYVMFADLETYDGTDNTMYSINNGDIQVTGEY